MTSNVDICNRALSSIGSKKKISSLSQDSIEAQTCNLVLTNNRDDLLRMAPWDCALTTRNLVYITSVPGTPENQSSATALWQPGQPSPPWTYEYQYPVDCLRACRVLPNITTGFTGVPLTSAIQGTAQGFCSTPAVRFAVQTDTFWPVISAAVAAAGTGYAVSDLITLNSGPPEVFGAPAILRVLTVDMSGGVTSVGVVSQVNGTPDNAPFGGSYFAKIPGFYTQFTSTGSGIGAGFTLTFGANQGQQRVILTDQQNAILSYVKQITDPNVMDTLFQSAWTSIVASSICMALTGDKALANSKIVLANESIIDARANDGNEGLTINDHQADWITAREGIYGSGYNFPANAFNWGGLWPLY